ncbi:MAG: hypothetical protein H0W88_04475 [Parachlamydiaceae bacterium]|nr:hypothetical protein [Parachlamydiaceae bacterium]
MSSVNTSAEYKIIKLNPIPLTAPVKWCSRKIVDLTDIWGHLQNFELLQIIKKTILAAIATVLVIPTSVIGCVGMCGRGFYQIGVEVNGDRIESSDNQENSSSEDNGNTQQSTQKSINQSSNASKPKGTTNQSTSNKTQKKSTGSESLTPAQKEKNYNDMLKAQFDLASGAQVEFNEISTFI